MPNPHTGLSSPPINARSYGHPLTPKPLNGNGLPPYPPISCPKYSTASCHPSRKAHVKLTLQGFYALPNSVTESMSLKLCVCPPHPWSFPHLLQMQRALVLGNAFEAG
ncbi:hypothetical protein C0992_011561 [Termitomyces sp. T32_za158]|nr:hypothetical protein C0992_011561 [Termitomyces sp. T32_za158]